MRKGLVVALAMLTLALVSSRSLVCEDGGPQPAAAIRPLHPTAVELETLDVRVNVFFGRSEVEAVFTLRNTGSAATVLMGFAERSVDNGEPHPGPHDFRAFVDGLEVPVKRDPDLVPEPPLGSAAAWHTWEVTFAAGQTRRVRYTCWSWHVMSEGGRRTGYVLTPAAAWHGNVGGARVSFELAEYLPYDIVHLEPAGYRFEGENLVWEWQDFEPQAGVYAFLGRGLSLRRSLRNMSAIYLAQEWEELSHLGRYGELLAQVEMHRDDEDLKRNPHLVPLYEARAQLGLGQTDDAVRNWQEILDLTLPEDHYDWRIYPAQDEAFYHLARHYHAAGNQDRVEELYQQLRRRPTAPDISPPFVLMAWMESLLPPERTANHPPTVRAVLGTDEPPRHRAVGGELEYLYTLEIHARDPDGDLVQLRWTIWDRSPWGEGLGLNGSDTLAPCQEATRMPVVGWLPAIPMRYRVEALDQRGNRGSTGILEYVPPSNLAKPGDEPPGTLEKPGAEPPAPHAPRRSAWPLVGGGVLAAALGALIFAWRRRRARSV